MQPKTHEPRQVHWVHGRPNRPSWYSRSSALKLLRVWVNLDSVMDDSYGAIKNRNPWAKTRNGGEWKVRNTAQGVETDNRFFPFARPSTNIFAALKTWQGGAQLTQNIMHLLHPVCQIFWFFYKKKKVRELNRFVISFLLESISYSFLLVTHHHFIVA